jgi:hypothetical protein
LSLDVINLILECRRRTQSHPMLKSGQLTDEVRNTLMGRTFLDTSIHHPCVKISGFGQGG